MQLCYSYPTVRRPALSSSMTMGRLPRDGGERGGGTMTSRRLMAIRAIVWLCWGERFIREAAASARSAAAIDADRILITDAAGAASAANQPEFTSIVTIELVHANNLAKT